MKQLKITFLLVVLMIITANKAFAHDIEVLNTNRVPIYYNFINGPYGKELYVTFRGEKYSSYSNEYTGKVVIPESVIYDEKVYPVTGISEYAFYNCKDLKELTIPNSVMSIGKGAFAWCWSLASISIPSSVSSIDSEAFFCCSGLTSIIVASGNSVYDSRYNCNAIIETNTNTLIQGCNKTVIPNDVTSIGDGAFYDCSSLTSITIPNSLTSIDGSAFYGCTDLKEIVSLINEPFVIYGKSSTYPVFSTKTFNNATLYVPTGMLSKYEATDGWKDFAKKVEGIPTGIKAIENDKTAESLETGNWYTLDGRCLHGKPTKKGIYIVNGHKVAIK